ncbi:FAD/NAD(P)-binding protein [Streptomyces sp. NPDC003952]
MSSGRMEVCLVGAGPRGLSVLERLCAQERKSPRWDHLTVHIVEPDPPGSGRVWRSSQSRHLLMNTVACQVTVYTDASVAIEGPLEEGPSLYQWAKALGPSALTPGAGAPYDDETLAEARDLGPDTYPTRALYGQYLHWVFGRVTASAAAHTTIRVHASRAVALEDAEPGAGPGGAQTVLLEDGTRLTGLGAVVLAQGHVQVRPTAREREFAEYAARHGLTYIAPSNPADVDLSAIAPGETVLLRGLGLNFFDYMALFTHARGGLFERVGGRLVYRPSGREPRLYAGSRRGVPYQARGENEKGAHGRCQPRLLTTDFVAALRARVPGGEPIRFGTELWPLISKEVRTVYYETLLARRTEPAAVAAFAEAFLRAADDAEHALLTAAGIGDDELWDWDTVARPYGEQVFRDLPSFRGWLRDYLDEDVRRAREGNVSGPFKAALDLLRDLRNELRLAIDHGGLDADSHRDELDRWYTPLNAFLSIGPPASRIEEMAALIDAGVLDVTGPGLRVVTDPLDPAGPAFAGTSADMPDLRVRATVLIEARLPEIDVRRTTDPLMYRLLSTGQARTHRIAGADGSFYETGGLAVSQRPYHLLHGQGVPHLRRFAYGVPTESVHWVTAAGIRPGVGSVTLEDSDAIAAAVLALPEPRPALRLPEAPAVAAGPALSGNAGAGAVA